MTWVQRLSTWLVETDKQKPVYYDYNSDAEALLRFVQNVYFGLDLSNRESMDNVKSSIVELVDEGLNHRSNGILITENGYFLTSRHCLEDKNRFVRFSQTEVYEIEPDDFYYFDCDLTIGKAQMPGSAEPKLYSIFQIDKANKVYCHQIAFNISRNEDGLVVKHVTLQNGSRNCVCENGFRNTDAIFGLSDATFGDSGSCLVSCRGELMGILSSGNEQMMTVTWENIYKGLELVVHYANYLKTR